MPCIELSRSGVHCGRVCGVSFTSSLVSFCMLSYIIGFLVPALRRGEVIGYVSFFLFTPSATMLVISLWRTFFTHPGRVPQSFDIDVVDRRVQEQRRARVTGSIANDPTAAASSGNSSNGIGIAYPTATTTSPPPPPPPLHVVETTTSTGTPTSSHITTTTTTVGSGNNSGAGGGGGNTSEATSSSSVSIPMITPNMCNKCHVYKVNRIHHCSTCGECILRMDHHCPWIGSCVGRDNHKFFILFLFYTIVTGVIVCATSFQSVDFFSFDGSSSKGDGNFGAMIIQFFAFIFTAMFALILIPFLCAVISNATEGTTTLEKKIAERNRRKKRAEQQRRVLSSSHRQQVSAGTSISADGSGAGTSVVRMEGSSRGGEELLPGSTSGYDGGGLQHVLDAGHEPTSTTPLTSVVAISNSLPNYHPSEYVEDRPRGRHHDEEEDDEAGGSCCCCNCTQTANQLEEIFGDSEESRRRSRLWWLVPVAPSFKPDHVNIDVHFM